MSVVGLVVLLAAAAAQPAPGAVTVPPSLASLVGEVERITVDDPTDVWSGATIVVAGQNVIVPRNLLADLPANRLTMQQLVAGAPPACLVRGESGLAKSDTCNTSGAGALVTIQANRTAGGNVIAGDVFFQKGSELITGTISFIDFGDGYFRLNGVPGDSTTGVMVRLNDPTTRNSRQRGPGCRSGSQNCSADARFGEDPDNYTQAFSTGYPLCIPSTVPRDFTDTLDLDNDGNSTETLTAQAAPDGTGDLLCPAANRTSLVAKDSRRMAPIQVGDSVTVGGNFETVGGVRFLSAVSTKVGTALSTSSAPDQPDYMILDEASIDAPGFDLNRARDLFIGATTEATSDAVIWSIHRDPAKNDAHELPLATVRGCDIAAGAGRCTNVLGAHTFRVRHDVDFAGVTKVDRNPCSQLRADPRFAAKGICPKGGTNAEMLAILSPTPHEVQARTGRKIADLDRAGGPVLKTIDVKGADAPNGQYLFPLGIGLGGIEVPVFAEINVNALGTPTIFAGLPWNLDRRLSPNGCSGPCESTPQPLDPFPFSGRDPRTQAPGLPSGPYSDPNYTAGPLSSVRNRLLSAVFAPLGIFDGDNSVLAWPPTDPAPRPITPTPGPSGGGDTDAPGAPTGLSAVAATWSQIDLSWKASTDNVGVTNYLVYRDGGGTPIATVAAASTSFSDAGVASASSHDYTVQALDGAGNTSEKSAGARATTPAAPGPVAALTPEALSFTAQPGGATAPQTATLSNNGSEPLELSSIVLTGRDAADFSRTTTCGATLAPGASCTIRVGYSPAAAGASTATLTVTGNSRNVAGSTHATTLDGTATAPPAPAATPGAFPANPIAAPGPTTTPNPGGARAAIAPKIAAVRAGRGGLRAKVALPAGAKVLRLRVLAAGRGRRRGAPDVLYESFHAVTGPAVVELRLRSRRLARALHHGHRFVLEATSGTSRTALGPATRTTFSVR